MLVTLRQLNLDRNEVNSERHPVAFHTHLKAGKMPRKRFCSETYLSAIGSGTHTETGTPNRAPTTVTLTQNHKGDREMNGRRKG